MKLLLITLEYPPYHGGIAHYYGHLVSASTEPITVLTNHNQQLVNEAWPLLKWLPGLSKVYSTIKSGGYDQLLVGQILPLGTIAFLLSFCLPSRYTIFLHGLDLSLAQASPWKKRLTRLILNRADHIISANSRTAAEARGLVNPEQIAKVTVVNPGIDPQLPSYDQNVINDLKLKYKLTNKKILLTVARLVSRKGIDLVIKAVSFCQDKNLHYLVIGQGPLESELRKLIQELDLSQQVTLLTEVDDYIKSQFFQLADIFLLTSRDEAGDYEGFGIVYLEAGLAGKPVIASLGGGVGDAVIDNETGLLVKAEPSAIKDAIIKLANYEGLRRRLGDNGRKRAQVNFAWSNQASKIINLLKNQ